MNTERFEMPVVYHPGLMLKEKIDEMGMSIKEFSIRASKPEKTIHAVIRGDSSVTADMAVSFEKITGIASYIWIGMQGSYAEYVVRKKREQEKAEQEVWAKRFDYGSMVKLGWVKACRTMSERAEEMLSFFRISSTQAWERCYLNVSPKVSFRCSTVHTKDPYNTAAWLRRGEQQAEEMETPPYSQDRLNEEVIPAIRLLIRENPPDFLGILQQLCKEAGMVLVYTPRLKGVPINGAMRWYRDRPVIQMSDKQKAFDVFCFSLMHEIGHVLSSKKKSLFLDYDDAEVSEDESKADAFASQTLLSEAAEAAIVAAGRFTKKDIEQYAAKYDTHPAIIVGRLHYKKLLPYAAHSNLIPHIEI